MKVIAITGGVAVGKSTYARELALIYSQSPDLPRVEIISTDGFLYSSKILIERGLMQRKGFPESYDQEKFEQFLKSLQGPDESLVIPLYSHVIYDLTGEVKKLSKPEVLIIEGLNLFPYADQGYFDELIFIDAPLELMKTWYLERHKALTEEARSNPKAFFHQFSQMSEEERMTRALATWETVNKRNYLENLLPFKDKADRVILKGAGHAKV